MAYDRGLLDTNIVIHLQRLTAEDLPADMAISAVTLAELAVGPNAATDPVERARRISVLQHAEATFDALPFDAEAARAFGVVDAAVRASGRSPRGRITDLMIASVAAANQLPLFTTNPDDFKGLEDMLTVVPVTRPGKAP